jgi:hypothetical protein
MIKIERSRRREFGFGIDDKSREIWKGLVVDGKTSDIGRASGSG